ncbi:MAG: exodeoxyribonuclease VII small subunit [Deltaproteobacteria bacterium]|nr:MAG: exodeoxyribonuclease VII small subunit [Deltaproteobacteria bacterium]
MAKKQTFEKAMEKLEAIVGDLEAGDATLDMALKKFEEGVKLSRFCSEKLDEMEQRISVLLKDNSGEITEKTIRFDEDENMNNGSI